MTDLDLYRRHIPKCPYASKGQNHTKCNCPIWVYGSIDNRPIRKSLKTRHWSVGLTLYDEMVMKQTEHVAVTVSKAVSQYLEDCQARHLAPSTVTSYRNVVEPFAEFCRKRFHDMRGLTLSDLSAFRASRQGSPKTQRKEIEHLRAFCAFCVNHGWIKENFAKHLKPPKDDGPVTMPFRSEQITALLEACDEITNNYTASADRARPRARALLLLLLYSGLRISDAMRLKRKQLKADGRLLVRIMKSGKPLYVRLHADCVDALKALPEESEYFLWSGIGKLSSAVGSARRSVAMIGKLARVKDVHPHRFRDTFSVELLVKGVDIRTVQLLLGHTSLKTTEKHYAPWVRSMQAKLDNATKKLDFAGKHRDK